MFTSTIQIGEGGGFSGGLFGGGPVIKFDKTIKVMSIEKLKNWRIQQKFMTEVKILAKKYPTKAPSQLIKLLFHGSSATDPRLVYQSEEGLDMRFSR